MFSIVIPLYNKELSIKNTIESVLNQTFQQFEIIIINDGSSDRSLEVVSSINDDRIKVFSKKNGGVSSARNFGIEMSTYEWIAFLDGDDLWFNNHLENIKDMIELFPNKRLFASSFIKSTDNFVDERLEGNENVYVVDNYFKDSLETHLIWTSIFVCHKECLLDNKFDTRLAIGEDFELFGRLVRLNSLVKSTKVTAIYRVEAENRSNIGKYKMNKSIFSILNFKEMTYPYEKIYYKKLIKQKLKDFLVLREYKSLIFLLKRYNIKLFI
ncbi:glycosyltransferase family 2 protein [Myroides odoratimimus]|uniref:glycosyltransferase family 2 protein n=1 Tax=Myroides odoratimimus TaxID=76832 RepID=UPI002DBB10A1|nr:glycosyltransferase family 2 protein [Myroides odoratimimus]MEC4028767.1 glycosyltransferase family 2 protein [Myroides odoratimimus]